MVAVVAVVVVVKVIVMVLIIVMERVKIVFSLDEKNISHLFASVPTDSQAGQSHGAKIKDYIHS